MTRRPCGAAFLVGMDVPTPASFALSLSNGIEAECVPAERNAAELRKDRKRLIDNAHDQGI